MSKKGAASDSDLQSKSGNLRKSNPRTVGNRSEAVKNGTLINDKRHRQVRWKLVLFGRVLSIIKKIALIKFIFRQKQLR
jgi:hypothetical protein